MTALTIKNIPESLYEEIKRTAKAHRRSINNEVIMLLEEKLIPTKQSSDQWIAAAQRIRAKIPTDAVSEADIEGAINDGRS